MEQIRDIVALVVEPVLGFSFLGDAIPGVVPGRLARDGDGILLVFKPHEPGCEGDALAPDHLSEEPAESAPDEAADLMLVRAVLRAVDLREILDDGGLEDLIDAFGHRWLFSESSGVSEAHSSEMKILLI